MGEKVHSGKKVVLVLLSGMGVAAAAVLAIGASVGNRPDIDSRRPAPSSSGGGSMWKNLDKAKKQQTSAEDERKPGSPW
jgi:hypothetical protein